MALAALTGAVKLSFSYLASLAALSSGISFAAPSVQNTVNASRSISFGGNVAGGANSVVNTIVTIAASGTATLNLQSLTDVINGASVWVRLKTFVFWLLGTTDDSVNGTTCSSVSIGNAGSNGCPLDMGAIANTRTLTTNSGYGDWTAYGTNSAAGITVSASVKNVLITNNDSVNAAAVLFLGFGATS